MDKEKLTEGQKKLFVEFGTIPAGYSKEDMIEFLALAIPKAKSNWFSADEFTKVWKAKCEQIIIKARFSFNEDKNTLKEIEKYAKQIKMK